MVKVEHKKETSSTDATESSKPRQGQVQADTLAAGKTADDTGKDQVVKEATSSAPDVSRSSSVEDINSPDNRRKNQEPVPARVGQTPMVRRAGPRENSGGGIRLTNRSGVEVRVITENKKGVEEWERDSIVTLMSDDTTEIIVEEGRRVVIDRV